MKLLYQILHSILQKRCVKCAVWQRGLYADGGRLICPKCGEILAFYYRYNGEVKAYLFQTHLRDVAKIQEKLEQRAAFRGISAENISFLTI